MGVPQVYRKTPERAITTYSFTDIADGSGNQTFHPYWTEDSNGFVKYAMSGIKLAVPTTTGTLNSDTENNWVTAPFNLPRTAKGTATLTGYMATGGKVTAQLIKLTGEKSGTLGSINETDATEYSFGGTTFSLVKTFTINGFRNKLTNEIKSSNETRTASCKVIYHYLHNDQTFEITRNTTSTSYVSETYPNQFPNEELEKIEVWIKININDSTVFTDTQAVFDQDITNPTETTISSSIATPDYGASAINFNLPLPLTQTTIKKDERLAIKITNTGAGFVVDPLNLIESTNSSLKLNIPFRIDL